MSFDLNALQANLKDTLRPQTQKTAEANLEVLERVPNFVSGIVQLIRADGVDAAVRFGAVIYFKNFVKRNWHVDPSEEGSLISESERVAIKSEIIPLLCSLPPNLQVQLSDCVSSIAETDFPAQWPDIIGSIRDKLSDTDARTNVSILQIAHSIFKRYRTVETSADIAEEILYVLENFGEKYVQLIQIADSKVEQFAGDRVALADWLNVIHVSFKIFYDLNYIEFPSFFEDNFNVFSGIMLKYISYNNQLVRGDVDDSEASIIEKIKGTICEIVILFSKKYDDLFKDAPQFVNAVWELLTNIGLEVKFDYLVSQAIKFLVSIAYQVQHREIFKNGDILKGLCEKVILPNMYLRETDEELFHDDPIEFIRRDLEGSNGDTRRGAASDLVSALLELSPNEVTEIFSRYVTLNLQEYEVDPVKNWKSKDLAMFLITSLSIIGQTAKLGATKVNELVPILPFVTSTVLPDLKAPEGSLHPLIVSSAIKFVMTFRSLLNKEQLFEILNIDLQKLYSDKYVIYTYAAVCIEKILGGHSGTVNDESLIGERDIQSVAPSIIKRLFELIFQGNTPQKISENDYMMRTIARIIVVAKSSLNEVAIPVLEKLIEIVQIVSQNPSNPQFNEYCFGAISTLVKHLTPNNPQLLVEMESRILPTVNVIFSQDISEFIPYAYHLMALLALSHTKQNLSQAHKDLLRPTLLPASWQNRELFSVMVEFLDSISKVDPEIFLTNNYLQQMLGVTRRLIGTKVSDTYGLQLLTHIFTNFPTETLAPFMKTIFMMLLTRLQKAKTDQFVRGLVLFFAEVFRLRKPGFGPDQLLQVLDSIQVGIFAGLLKGAILPNLATLIRAEDRKIILEGWSSFIETSASFQQPQYAELNAELKNQLTRISQLTY